MHWLRDINPESRRGVCAVCGPVAVKRRGGGYWRCAAQEARYRRERRERERARADAEREADSRLEATTPCCEIVVVLPGFTWDDETQDQRLHTTCACGRDWIVQRLRLDFEGGPVDDVEWIAEVQLYVTGRLAERVTGRSFASSRRLPLRGGHSIALRGNG